MSTIIPSGSRVHLLFFAVNEFAGEPKARVFEQIRWVPMLELAAVDFLEGDLDFVQASGARRFPASPLAL